MQVLKAVAFSYVHVQTTKYTKLWPHVYAECQFSRSFKVHQRELHLYMYVDLETGLNSPVLLLCPSAARVFNKLATWMPWSLCFSFRGLNLIQKQNET